MRGASNVVRTRTAGTRLLSFALSNSVRVRDTSKWLATSALARSAELNSFMCSKDWCEEASCINQGVVRVLRHECHSCTFSLASCSLSEDN